MRVTSRKVLLMTSNKKKLKTKNEIRSWRIFMTKIPKGFANKKVLLIQSNICTYEEEDILLSENDFWRMEQQFALY